jgi:Ca2+-binding RTX toxin-like protein
MAFTSTNIDGPTGTQELVNQLVGGAPVGFSVVAGSSTLQGLTGGLGSVSLFDSIKYGKAKLGAGILLTSGDGTPPESNTQTNYGQSIGTLSLGDTELTDIIRATFNPNLDTKDATILKFDINVTDPNQKFVVVDLAFGSDEFPEFSNSNFVDIAGFFVNGVNYAYFGNNTNKPLSVLNRNKGNFQDNAGGKFAIEYDGISAKLTIFAPVKFGVNTIKLAVADTNDTIYDSGLFAANLRLSKTGVSGLVKTIDGNGKANELTGKGSLAEVFNAGAGNDKVVALAGNDVLDLGKGKDTGDGGKGIDLLIGGLGKDIMIGGGGADTFQFVDLLDSKKAKSKADIIEDFSRKQGDKIDITLIDANTTLDGDQDFTFIAQQKFNKVAGELHFVKGDGGVYLEGDVNGDGLADFAVFLDGISKIAIPDLIG